MAQQVVSQQAYDKMTAFAAQQAQKATRATLMTEFGLSTEDLEGEFASPREMRMHAELIALKRQVAGEAGPVAHEPEPPPGDLGGPTAVKPTTFQELDVLYERAKKMGRTRAGRRALLDAIYRDSRKASRVRPGGE